MNNNDTFEYKVSVIVPIYNVGEYLRGCLESLLAQTIDHDLVEVLLINDGSTDGSLDICNEYSRIYSMFKVFSKENEGVSATRNYGITEAKGKYIMFLDADDAYTPETIKNVTDFFDKVYDEVDVVTFKRVMYRKGAQPKIIDRYKNLTEQKVYDLEKSIYFTQNTLNIATKNNKDVLFDTSLFQGEDQKYVMELVVPKMKIGYCLKAEYKYIQNDSGAMANQKYSFYLYEQRMNLWEGMIEKYGELPKYVQSIILDNWSWELISDCIFPYYLKGDEYDVAMERIRNIVLHIDDETILNHPRIDGFHKHFWISMKKDNEATLVATKEFHAVVKSGKTLYQSGKMEIILHKLEVKNNKLYVLGFIKSPVFNYTKEKPTLYANVNDDEKIGIELFESVHSFYKTKAHTNYFWGFRFIYDVASVETLKFSTVLEGVEYPSSYYCMPNAVLNKTLGIDWFVRNGYKIKFDFKDTFYVSELTSEEAREMELSRKFKEACDRKVYNIRNTVINGYSEQKRIWLYSDCNTGSFDNAYYQFKNDFDKNDGVERYYVYDGNKMDINEAFSDEQREYLIRYGTDFHKILYLSAEYVLCSFSDKRPRIPFESDKEYAFYRDLKQPETIYLQHGVCHADLRYLQAAERCKVDKIVVSSEFEKENYVKNYNYCEEDIISTGMARYDYINKESKPQNKIIFAPSWRSYLMFKDENAAWNRNEDKLLKSDYFINIKNLLNNERLAQFLEENDLYFDVKLHPHMKTISDLFMINCDRINITVDSVNLEDYKIFITDFSSFVFDYAYLNRPVMYFVPDMVQFESGMNHYRKLDLPFEKAFGKLTVTADDAVDELNRIASNNFVAEEPYKERMEKFYIPMDNCCERLYEYLITK